MSSLQIPSGLQRFRSLALLALLISPLVAFRPAAAQMLLDATGAATMQGTLNNISVPGANAVLNKTRATTSAIQATSTERSATMSAAGAAPPTAGPGFQVGAPAPGTVAPPTPPPGASPARVNGRSVPVCTHGGLCHWALLRAMGLR